MSTKVTVILEDNYPEVDECSTTSVSMTSDEPDIRFLERVFRAALGAFEFHPDTIDRMFANTADCCDEIGRSFGGTCSNDCGDCRCTPVDEADLSEVSGVTTYYLGSAPALADHTHPDKDVEALHSDDIVARAPRTPGEAE
jgi:hypothetical protein